MVSILYFLSSTTFFGFQHYDIIEEHAIYLSTIEMVLDDKEISVVIKVFEDDLRDALRAHHGHVIDTIAASFLPEVESYFDDHLTIKDVALSTIKVSLVGDSYQIAMTGVLRQDAEFLSFEVDYFTELFPTQQNVLHLSYGGDKKYHIFKKGKGGLKVDLGS